LSPRPHKWRDVAWKLAIVDGARDAVKYFMPDLAADMNLSKEVTGITDLALPLKGSDSDKNTRFTDVFLNVPLMGEEDGNVACFVEQQHEGDSSLGERMLDSYVRLRASRLRGRTTGFALFTGSSGDMKSYAESCYGFDVSIRYRTFHLPSYDVKELREDKRPFGRVMYAGRLSLGSEEDVALRERYAWEILDTANAGEYDERQRKFILEFANRIFWLDDPAMNREVREAYKVKTISLDEYVKEIYREEAIMIAEARGGTEMAKKMAKNLLTKGVSPEIIAQSAGLPLEQIQSLAN
jgi:hypothetical protein